MRKFNVDPLFAILDDDNNVVVVDSFSPITSREQLDRSRVGLTELEDGTVVSTVFIGINTNLTGDEPNWFETMVFENGGRTTERKRTYATYEAALRGHDEMVEEARNG